MRQEPADARRARIQKLLGIFERLSDGQLFWLEKVVNIFDLPTQYECHDSDIFTHETLHDFGDALKIHHAFSIEPFSKDKFEYVLEQVLKSRNVDASLAPKGLRGHDITVRGQRFSLKTQADKGIKSDVIWISKFMELGKGKWGDDPDDLKGLRDAFLEHLTKYDRIFSLRALRKAPDWYYELVEIPKKWFEAAKFGTFEMKMDSKQMPKPGFCYVRDPESRQLVYSLYFDGGGERKLQVHDFRKDYCRVHSSWGFSIPKI
jgi:hypothetical protein